VIPLVPGTATRVPRAESRGDAFVLALPRGTTDVVLGPREERAVEEFRAWPLRDAEWRAGRYVTKQLVFEVFGIVPFDVEVLAAESGAPELFIDGKRSPHTVSISHTDHWAVAAVSPHPIGVDVADDEDGARLPNIARRVFSDGEAEACGAFTSVARQAAVWAMKEAGLKLHIGGVFSPGARSIRVLSIDPPRAEGIQLAVYRLPNACVAVAHE
jgi:phosphopantetheinyl transferase